MKTIRPGKMIKEVLGTFFKKPITTRYPFVRPKIQEGFRGEIAFDAEKCIGCQLCVKDCPADAITIRKTGDKEFEAEIDLAKCIFCGQCVDSCPKKALLVTKNFELARLDSGKLKVIFRAKTKDDTEKKS